MRIFHIASEMAPIAKVGGLGDVVYGLSKKQQENGESVRVILPGYTSIDRELIKNGIPITLLGRYEQIYGEGEQKRFISFCLEVIEYLHENPCDILHLHDWPVALLAPLIRLHYPKLKVKGIVLSVHNLHHQGICLKSDLPFPLEELAVDATYANLLIGGLIYSDAIVAVSPKYAEEILSPEEGEGLEKVLQEHKDKLFGVLNGIDTGYWDPSCDPHLVYHYNFDDLSGAVLGKESNRAHLFYELDMDRCKSPLVCSITRLVPQKGLKMIEKALIFTLENGGNFILLGSSPEPKIQKHFEALAEKYKGPNLHCHFNFDEKLAHMLVAAADLIVIPSLFEPCGLTQMIAMRYGCIPLVRAVGGLANTVFDEQNGLTFLEATEEAIEIALKKAFDIYRGNPLLWHNLIENGSSGKYCWSKSAIAYDAIYKKIGN